MAKKKSTRKKATKKVATLTHTKAKRPNIPTAELQSALPRMSSKPVRVVQELARHSDPRLTMNTYAHVRLFDAAAALEALPSSDQAVEAQMLSNGDGRRQPRPQARNTGATFWTRRRPDACTWAQARRSRQRDDQSPETTRKYDSMRGFARVFRRLQKSHLGDSNSGPELYECANQRP